MKKNRHTGNIEQEKLRLRVKQLELEKQIRRDWEELKAGLSPHNFFSHTESSAHNKKTGKSLLSGAVNTGFNYFTNRVSDIASEKIESGMKKGIDKLTEKLRTVFKK